MCGGRTPVLLLVNHWAQKLGGAEMSLLDLLQPLSSVCRVHLVTSESGILVERASALGVTCHVIPCRSALGSIRRGHLLLSALRAWSAVVSFLFFSFRLSRLIQRIAPRLIHANVPKSHMAVLLSALMGDGIPRTLHMREIFHPRSVPWTLYRLLGGATPVIAVSQAAYASLPPNLRTNAVVIHNGIAIPEAFKREHPEGRVISFVYLGRVVPWKGCHLLIDAFARVAASIGMTRVHLSIIGDTIYWSPAYREELKRLVHARGLQSCCDLLPHTENPYEELARHDVFCTASEEEPFGRSVAEAQACALPVVAFATGGIGEIVTEETGILVPMGDIAALAGAMERLARDPALIRTMGDQGRRRMNTLFNRELQVSRIVSQLVAWAGKGVSKPLIEAVKL